MSIKRKAIALAEELDVEIVINWQRWSRVGSLELLAPAGMVFDHDTHQICIGENGRSPGRGRGHDAQKLWKDAVWYMTRHFGPCSIADCEMCAK